MNIADFKEGGAKRQFITAIGILSLIDAADSMTEELENLIKNNYTMCDGYMVEEESENTEETPVEETEETPVEETEETPVEETEETPAEETEGISTENE